MSEPAATAPLSPSPAPDDQQDLLVEAPPLPMPGEALARLASNRFAVHKGTEVFALATAMDKTPDVMAVGVVDENDAPLGVISRRHLFDHLGKMYGRDLYKRKLVSELVQPARSFRADLNVFAAAELLRDDLRRMDDTWYLLVDPAGRFQGVLSSRNLLIYLSETTARDLALARRLQTSIVSERFSADHPRLTLACYSKMAKEVGGDFYAVKELDANRVLLALCDVSGKGIAASLVTAVLGGIFDTYSAQTSLRGFLRRLNRYLFDTFRLDYFVTGVFIELDRERGEATICDMGHSYLLAMRGASLLRPGDGTSNPPLGVAPETVPVLGSCRMGPGDLFLLFTDGLVDQRNPGGEDYTEARLWKLLRKHPDLPVEELGSVIERDCERFRQGQPQGDDLTFMILRYR